MLAFLLTIAFLLPTKGQDPHKLDSLRAVLSKEKEPAKRAATLLDLASLLPRTAYEQAMDQIQEASAIFKEKGDYKGLINAHLLLGDLHFRRQQFALALQYDSLGIRLADSVGYPEGKVQLLGNQARDYSISGNHKMAEWSAKEALAIESKLPTQNFFRLVNIYNLLGITSRTRDSLQQSLFFFDEGLRYEDSLTRSPKGERMLVNLYMNKGTTLTKLQRFDDAVDAHLAAMRIREKLGDSVGMQQSFNNIANVFRSAAEDEKALEYYKKSLEISRHNQMQVASSNTLVNMANIYFNQNRQDTAYALYEEAIQLAESMPHHGQLHLAHHNYGNSLRKSGDLNQAKKHLELALHYAEMGGGISNINISRSVLGRVYFELGDLTHAEQLLEQTLQQTDTTTYTDNLMSLYQYLRDLEEKKGDYRAAYHYQSRFSDLYRKRLTESERIAVLKAENQYQLDRKDLLMEAERNEALQKRRTILVTSIAIILLLLALSAIILLRRKQLDERHLAEVQQLAANHRLETAQALRNAEEKERKKIADRLHDEVGGLLSIARLNVDQLKSVADATPEGQVKLQTTQNLLSEVSDTVRNISHVLMPATLERRGLKSAVKELIDAVNAAGAIKVEEVIDGFIDTDNWEPDFCHTVYRIVQEIINNTLKHAGADHLLIQMVELDHSITIYIEDNGKGIDTKESGEGLGMSLLQNNIAYYDGAIEINGRENEGTFILIELPIRLKPAAK